MSCPICGETASWPVPHQTDAQVEAWRAECGDRDSYGWRLCRRCGNAYPTRPPDRRVLQRIWEANRALDERDPQAAERVWAYRRAISRAGAQRSFELFAPLVSAPGRFLDIGCGLGETVSLFAQRGWQAEGIDPDPAMVVFHRELGVRSRIGPFEALDIDTGYRIIHCAHAIYFVTDPVAMMRRVRDRLAPDGLFGVVLADFMAHSDAGLPGYAHSFFPTGSSMRYALAVAGFETVLSRRRSGSIFIAARPAAQPSLPRVWPVAIRMLHRTKALRHALLGRPYLALRRLAKAMLGQP